VDFFFTAEDAEDADACGVVAEEILSISPRSSRSELRPPRHCGEKMARRFVMMIMIY
jgi:hypothetical protein